MSTRPRFLVLETSHRIGTVALSLGDAIVGARLLDESRRHARDLVPAIQELLRQQTWRAAELDGVIVSRGPGSYTGLRVGIMSAKTLAFATGCALLAIDTFDAIRLRANMVVECADREGEAPAEPRTRGMPTLERLGGSVALPAVSIGREVTKNIDVIADAQQDNVYVQRFGSHPEPLAIVPLSLWLESALSWHVAVTGPGLETFAERLPAELNVLPRETWTASPASLLQIGLERFHKGERDDWFAVEPLYLRASSAEEKWAKLHPPSA